MNDGQRCATCKWWRPPRRFFNPDWVPDEGLCELTAVEEPEYVVHIHPESKAHISVGDGEREANSWPIGLITKPDFYCNQWHAKDDSD